MALSPKTLKECDRLRREFRITEIILVCDQTTEFRYSDNAITAYNGEFSYTLNNVTTGTPLVIELIHLKTIDQEVPALAQLSARSACDQYPDLILTDGSSSIASQTIVRYFPQIDKVETPS